MINKNILWGGQDGIGVKLKPQPRCKATLRHCADVGEAESKSPNLSGDLGESKINWRQYNQLMQSLNIILPDAIA
ncbi:hypothetical protein [Nostoc sp. NMS4]|uniref:hypothetical protein n=1 Tax=Nostoc sp. NMS4 TaxID=2815390 RepID=UPI0025FD43CF|nr:hypothetical protein [Nostoc sp. NMS4]MBN3922565.1 hypothetical protein [Nostoc sp. NMS4]